MSHIFGDVGGPPGAPGGALPLGTEAGQILEWSGTLWVPKRQTLSIWEGGSQGLGALADQFLGSQTYGVTGQATEALAGGWVIPVDGVIDRFFVRHLNTAAGSANPVTYTVHLQGANTTLVVGPVNTNTAGPHSDLVNKVNVSAGDRFSIRATWPTAAAQQIRIAFSFRIQSRNVSP